MRCFVLAGGFATRLWPLTETRAKPLLPLAGRPLLTHLLAKVPEDMPVTVSTNAVFADDMHAWAKTMKRPVTVHIEDAVHDDRKPGALGATKQWLEETNVEDDILLLAGDNYVGFDLRSFISSFAGDPLLAAHDVGDVAAASGFGTVIVEKGEEPSRVRAFEEKPARPSSTLVSTGCYVLPASVLPVLREYARDHPDNIGGIFEELLRQKRTVRCKTYTEPWRDIGTFRSYLATHDELLAGKQLLEPSATVDRESALAGSVYVGEGAQIERCIVRNSMIFGGVRLHDAVIEDCVIDEGCDIAGTDLRGMMVRRGTVLRRKK